MKVLKFINYLLIIINIVYIVLLNTFYVQLPVPHKTYLRDIKVGGILPNCFINISICGLIMSIIISLVYIFASKNNNKEKKINIINIIFNILFCVIEIVYQCIG